LRVTSSLKLRRYFISRVFSYAKSKIIRYGFVDTYFDAPDQAKETVEQYHEDATRVGGMHTDPLTFGVMNAENSIQAPREYFLFVFRVRIEQVKREWEQVVSNVRKSIREYEQVSSLLLYLRKGDFPGVNLLYSSLG
jgi:hypothetical protein